MLMVAPARLVGGVVPLGALLERHELLAGGALRQHGGLAGVDRVDAARQLLAGLRRQLAGQRQRYGAHRAQAHRPADAIPRVQENPGLRAALGDLEMQIAAVGVPAALGHAAHAVGRELVPGSRHF